ncbi:hypothetical protein Rleg9DRAFT_0478 [Rhizobium leguminosarum bv. trifolii WSM597]|uniref:DUF4231 domain-containing protein n=1 Tax=Rhizobium leguminosarum bv. trifolii WSM597 TaxID=754764 RepID=J0GW30_RHILT|nr:DUF4231 domain-containing protein [Rhizobium leguminosarum]EJB01738.1 hypothetical protein Rleg9DRAFT_0478 [Rhizobium leguminosarum bv. trifolii WSM597]
MITEQFDYPALYKTAGKMSADSQMLFLWLVRGEYALLFMAAVLSMNFYPTSHYFIIPALILIVSLVILIFRSLQKPEQDWYRGRALAESIKTSCWKYCMRSEPFGDNDSVATRRAEFRTYLTEILRANRLIGDRLPADNAAEEQITTSMEAVRALPLEERKKYYDINRVRNQRTWYAKKASGNKKSSRNWMIASVAFYGIAIVLSLVRITDPGFVYWPVEPVIVVASSILGWVQIKKFNELASSYTLTAHEIGIIQGRIADISREEEFSKFVLDAEQAFSREHTQWVARQQHT